MLYLVKVGRAQYVRTFAASPSKRQIVQQTFGLYFEIAHSIPSSRSEKMALHQELMARVHPCRPRINSIASKKSKGVIKHVCKSPNMIANFIHQELSDFRKLSSVTVSSKFITCSYMTRLFKM